MKPRKCCFTPPTPETLGRLLKTEWVTAAQRHYGGGRVVVNADHHQMMRSLSKNL